ncbi:hypothetical protein B5K03_33660 [Rhizobium phaseoli]|uniref:DUF982 domain-containing protein n=1 Tax=Rhizobium phaseoli TaxID=396 RepID=UPI000D67FB4E|nr:DUF982 domain-containing protein [Rhizobium phaseoli]PWI49890.1 hypothetical protein B5K03_33660 [Rhizobium phaseoli]
MSKRRWEAPVLVICKRTGRMLMVSTTEEALNTLLNAWPVCTGKAFLRALQVCNDVEAGLRTPNEARDSFIAAAREADIPIKIAMTDSLSASELHVTAEDVTQPPLRSP